MKSLRDSSCLALALLIATLAGCGQKGPLYLPAKPAPMQTPAPVPASPTAPSTTDSTAPAPK